MTGRGLVLFVARRLGVLGVLLVIVSFVVFSLLSISPGSAVDVLLGINPRTPETVHALRVKYHLDQPFLTQYWIWARGAARFDFGDSIQTTLPVMDEIKARLSMSLALGIYAYILAMLFGVGLGITAALRRRRAVDRGIVAGAIVALSTPAFVGGVLLIYLFGIVIPLFPVSGPGLGFVDQVWHLTLPAVALALMGTAYLLIHTRTAMSAVMDQDYVTFARARGASQLRVLFGYGLRNALVPVVTMSGVVLGFMVVGAVFVEATFSLPGIGQLLVQSARTKDLPMIQGVAMVVAGMVMFVNLMADLVLIAVDPRIRLGRASR